MENFEKLSDRELYGMCKLYGGNARLWAKKFAALLPEVEKRQLYTTYGFYSIFEFAAKLAGMNRETVIDILRVSKKLEDKPLLKSQMETQGWNKLRVVATIATKENEKILAEKVKEMSKPTLETWVHEIRKQNQEGVQFRPRTEYQEKLIFSSDQLDPSNSMNFEIENRKNSLDPQRIFLRIPLKPETELRLRQLQKKLSKECRAPVDLDEVLEMLMDNYEKAHSKQTVHKNLAENTSGTDFSMPRPRRNLIKDQSTPPRPALRSSKLDASHSRYIPKAIKNFLSAKFSGRCAFRNCQKLPEIFHHTRRFAINPSHDPDYLAPLCKNHERLAHHGLISNEEKPPGEWYVKSEPDKSSPKYWIDQKVQQYRAPP